MHARLVVAMSLVTSIASAAAPEAGFTPIFDGSSLAGWSVAQPAPGTPAWRIEEGELRAVGGAGDISTAQAYSDLDLRLEWKIDMGSGVVIGLRGRPAVHVRDIPQGSGSIWSDAGTENELAPALTRADRPAREWNTLRIVDIAGRLSVYVNDIPTTIDTPRDAAEVGPGPVQLLRARGTVSIRNVRVRALEGTRAAPATPALVPGARLAILGDSITEQQLYSRFIESYLRACAPELDVSTFQFGWSGERSPEIAKRLASDVLWWKPTAATILYGMNDGRYRPYEPAIGEEYIAGLGSVLDQLGAAGVRAFPATPPVVDTETFKTPAVSAIAYNQNLGSLRDLLRERTRTTGVSIIHVHDHMASGMNLAKAFYGATYDVAGVDGVHPRANGHLLIAMAMLQGLGVKGPIGTIEVDLGAGSAKVSEGHRITGSALVTTPGAPVRLDLESSRIPFALWGDDRSPDGPQSIARVVGFSKHLNNFTLRVKGAWLSTRVTWGGDSRVVTAAELDAGVNLTDLFRMFPTDERFLAVDAAVARKQALEREMMRVEWSKLKRDASGAITDPKWEEMRRRWNEYDQAARAAMRPVRHSIVLEQAK